MKVNVKIYSRGTYIACFLVFTLKKSTFYLNKGIQYAWVYQLKRKPEQLTLHNSNSKGLEFQG